MNLKKLADLIRLRVEAPRTDMPFSEYMKSVSLYELADAIEGLEQS
jgi:hypothetical protein